MKKTISLIVLVFLTIATADAVLTLQQARQDGKICECPNGLVAAVPEKCKDDKELQAVRDIAAATNSIRRNDIHKIANKDSITEAMAGKIIAEKIRKKYQNSTCKGTRCPKI